MIFILYLFFASIVYLYFVLRSKTKYLMGLILFWLYSMPFFYKNPIQIPFLNFDLNATRMLFIGIVIIFVISLASSGIKKQKMKNFEVWLIFLVASVLIAETINFSAIGIQKYVSDTSYALTFGLLYFTIQWNLHYEEDISILKKSILVFGVISSCVSFVQFMIDPEFLRIGAMRNAFGEYSRANGLFPGEFDQALFLIVALALNWSMAKQKSTPFFYIAIFGLSVFFTMHRVSWAAFALSVLAMFYVSIKVDRKRARVFIPLMFLLAAALFFTITAPWESYVSNIPFLRNLISERVTVDTWTIRTQYYTLALQVAQKYPLGLGMYGPEYVNLAYLYGLPLNRNFATLELTPYVVHNSFLATIVKYGWLGFVSLFGFLAGAILHYIKVYRVFSKRWAVPIIIIGAYIFFSVTQDFSFAAEMQSLLVFNIALAIYGIEERRIKSVQHSSQEVSLSETN